MLGKQLAVLIRTLLVILLIKLSIIGLQLTDMMNQDTSFIMLIPFMAHQYHGQGAFLHIQRLTM